MSMSERELRERVESLEGALELAIKIVEDQKAYVDYNPSELEDMRAALSSKAKLETRSEEEE